MRILCLIVLAFFSILEITPIPIAELFLMWIVIFRPEWFYELVLKIYKRN